MARISELVIVCLWAITFAAVGAWSHVSSAPFPLPGLQKIAESNRFSLSLQVAAVLVAASWLAVRRWQTRERLLVFQGIALALFIQGLLYIGVPFGLAFACFAGIAKTRSAQAE
jgi:hypothetical protein